MCEVSCDGIIGSLKFLEKVGYNFCIIKKILLK